LIAGGLQGPRGDRDHPAGRRPGVGRLTVMRTAGAATSSDLYGTALPAGAAVIVSRTFPLVTSPALGRVVLAVAVEARSVTGKNVSIP
jgi:hypothetical protein